MPPSRENWELLVWIFQVMPVVRCRCALPIAVLMYPAVHSRRMGHRLVAAGQDLCQIPLQYPG